MWNFILSLTSAPDDLPLPSQLHSILLSLRHTRLAKIRQGLRPLPQSGSVNSQADTGAFSGGGDYLRLTGLTAVEVAEMRGFLGGTMGLMRSLRDPTLDGGEGGDGDGDDMNA